MDSNNTPPTASSLYKTLHATAIEFVHSSDQIYGSTERMDTARIKNIRSENGFEHSFGHNHLVSTKPMMAGTQDADGFIQHMGKMQPYLKSWDTTITEIVIDETKKMAVVRASYHMLVEGASQAVENDILWFLTMDEDGEKVKKSVEFVDAAATQEIGSSIKRLM
jgi:ketosteroid isomerase-like protein